MRFLRGVLTKMFESSTSSWKASSHVNCTGAALDIVKGYAGSAAQSSTHCNQHPLLKFLKFSKEKYKHQKHYSNI